MNFKRFTAITERSRWIFLKIGLSYTSPSISPAACQTSVSILNLLMLLLLSLTTVAQLLNLLGCCGGGSDSGGSSSSASSRQLSADSKSIRSDVESPPDGYLTVCWPAKYTFSNARSRTAHSHGRKYDDTVVTVAWIFENLKVFDLNSSSDRSSVKG